MVIGIDVGGANIKYWSSLNRALARRFPLWKFPERLSETIVDDLRQLLSAETSTSAPTSDPPGTRRPVTRERSPSGGDPLALAVTMTGELADCFASRRAGVLSIRDQVVRAASMLKIGSVAFYGTDGDFHSSDAVADQPGLIASANWHALASHVAAEFPTATLLIDLGSTTTDLIPLDHGRVATAATTDHQRLREGSLVYVGCRRTPVCALVDSVRFRGDRCAVMNEVFATIDDACLWAGTVPPDADDFDTADQGPRTIAAAGRRLARMIGLDAEEMAAAELDHLADQVLEAAVAKIEPRLATLDRGGLAVVAGHGNELLRDRLSIPMVYLSDRWGSDAARCAPSRAIAMLYQSRVGEPCGE